LKHPFVGPIPVFYAYQAVKKYFPENPATVLEVGCGLGAFLFRCAKDHPKAKIVGLDHSEELISFLNQHYSDKQNRIQFIHGDFTSTILPIQ